jgi:hypothetical protein
MVEDDRAPSPEETMRLIEEQSAVAAKRLRGDLLLLQVPWGIAWLLGFGAFFLRYGLDGTPDGPISLSQALAVLFGTQILAGVCTAIGLTRVNRGMRGESTAKGAMYTFAWLAGVAMMTVTCLRYTIQLPEAESTLLWSGGMLAVVALLYMSGGAIWAAWPMFFMGVWIAAVNVAGLLLGVGWHALLSAVLLGAGQIVAGLLTRWRG